MEMTTTKTVAVFAVIFGCFAILYPKIFHPMLLHITGLTPPSKSVSDDMIHKMPPHLQKGPGMARTMHSAGGGGPMADDISKHLKPGPHPGLRAAAEMRKQAGQTTGTGKGMMTVVLPMYAVGIVVYLIYTLTKVFGRGGSKDKATEDYLQGHFKNSVRYDGTTKRFVPNIPPDVADEDDSDEDAEFKEYKLRKKQQRDLERLLLKADKNEISQFELTELKRRLLETESQMTRILSAMGTLEDRLSDTMGEEPQQQQQSQKRPEDVPMTTTVDSSPDMESYDIIGGNHDNQVENDMADVEELGAEDIEYYHSDELDTEEAGNEQEEDNEVAEEDPCDADGEDDEDGGEESADANSEEESTGNEMTEDQQETDEDQRGTDEEAETSHPDLRHRKTATSFDNDGEIAKS